MERDEVVVSIICDCFNHDKYIAKCLDGFLMQECDFNFEILIHDDASTDDSAAIIKEYEVKYPNIIKPIYQTENQYSKNIGIWDVFQFPRVKGKYIAICEGDDYWIDPLKLQKQVDFLDNNEDYGLVITNVNFFYQEKNEFIHSVLNTEHFPIINDFDVFLNRRGYMAPCTWLGRKDILIDKSLKLSEFIDGTYVMYANILMKTKVYFINEATTVYRILAESASHSASEFKMFLREVGLYNSEHYLIERFKKQELNHIVEERFINEVMLILRKANSNKSKDFNLIIDSFSNFPLLISSLIEKIEDLEKKNKKHTNSYLQRFKRKMLKIFLG